MHLGFGNAAPGRPWSVLLAALIWTAPACSSDGGAPSAKVPHAPGVVAALRFEPPAPRPDSSGQNDMVSLQAPLSRHGVHSVLSAFFKAITAESRVDLSKVVLGNAMAHSPNTTATSLLSSWSRRFARERYDAVDATSLYAPQDVELFEQADVRRLRLRKDFHLAPGPSELIAVVALNAPDELFGARMELLLEPSDDGYKIRAVFEDYTLR